MVVFLSEFWIFKEYFTCHDFNVASQRQTRQIYISIRMKSTRIYFAITFWLTYLGLGLGLWPIEAEKGKKRICRYGARFHRTFCLRRRNLYCVSVTRKGKRARKRQRDFFLSAPLIRLLVSDILALTTSQMFREETTDAFALDFPEEAKIH